MYYGCCKKILKYLGFLRDDYGMEFHFQTFDDYRGFYGPADAYSFSNDNGCITFHNLVQRGEWGWYTSDAFSNDQYRLLQNEIDQSAYLSKSYLLDTPWLKDLAEVLKREIDDTGTAFNVKIK